LLNVSLVAHAGEDSVQFRVVSISGSNYYSDMAIDDFTVFQPADVDYELVSIDSIPTGGCSLGLTDVYASVIENGAIGLASGDTLFFSYSDGTTTINDTVVLSAAMPNGSTYQHMFTAQADFSVPATYNITVTVTTSQDPNVADNTLLAIVNSAPLVNTFPYYEDFESGQGGWMINNNVNGTWAFGTPAKDSIEILASWLRGNVRTPKATLSLIEFNYTFV